MKINPRDIKIEYFKSSGPGGQHKNKRFSAVRVSYLPLGISSVATEERSQAQNKAVALQRLYEKIAEKTKKKRKRIPIKLPKALKEKILEYKRRRSQLKQLRRPVHKED